MRALSWEEASQLTQFEIVTASGSLSSNTDTLFKQEIDEITVKIKPAVEICLLPYELQSGITVRNIFSFPLKQFSTANEYDFNYLSLFFINPPPCPWYTLHLCLQSFIVTQWMNESMSAFLWLSYLIRSPTGFPGLVQAGFGRKLAICHCDSMPGAIVGSLTSLSHWFLSWEYFTW